MLGIKDEVWVHLLEDNTFADGEEDLNKFDLFSRLEFFSSSLQ